MKINLNNANLPQLLAIPRITVVQARAILNGRPYHNATNLAQLGLPAATISYINDNFSFDDPGVATHNIPDHTIPTPPVNPANPTNPANPVSHANMTVVDPSDDLPSLLCKAKDGQQFKLKPTNYKYSNIQATIQAANILLDATGATLDWQLNGTNKKTSPTSCFKTLNSGTKILGGTWKTNAQLFGLYAPTTLTNMILLDGATQFAKADQQKNNSGAGTIIDSCTIGICNSVPVYFAVSATLKNSKVAGSVGEVGVRVDANSETGSNPDNVIIDNNQLHSLNSNAKGSTELRVLGKNCLFTNNINFDYLRVGQDHAQTLTDWANGLIIRGNKWMVFPPSNSVPLYLMLMHGTTILVDNNDFLVNDTFNVAGVSEMSNVTFTNNRRHLTQDAKTCRPHIWAGSSDNNHPVDGGGNTVVPYSK